MLLTTNPAALASLAPDTSIQPIMPARVKPLEQTALASTPGTGNVGAVATPSLAVTTQPGSTLQEVSIHKTVIPPRTLSPPLCPSLCRPSASAQGPPSSLLGHPREGQSASLLGGKYILLDELEGSTLHRCLDITSHEELLCKVSNDNYR